MAFFSSGVEYGLHCLLCLVGTKDGAPAISTRDIGELQGLPVEFVAKIFTRLQRANLVTSSAGLHGGFRLARDAREISVLDVVTAIDGEKSLFECKEIRDRCAVFEGNAPEWATQGVCSIHAVMLEAEKSMQSVLRACSLQDIANTVQAKADPNFGGAVTDWLVDRGTNRRPRKNLTGPHQGEEGESLVPLR